MLVHIALTSLEFSASQVDDARERRQLVPIKQDVLQLLNVQSASTHRAWGQSRLVLKVLTINQN